MSGGFSFPPPPPPPPKPPQDQHNQSDYGAQSRGRGRGRGDSRGGFQQRGRGQRGGGGGGNFSDGPGNARGGPWQSNPTRGGSNHSGPHRGNVHHSYNSHNAQHGYSNTANTARGNAQGNLTSASPPRTLAGHKRKLDALRPPPIERAKRPEPETAPAVPGFGTPILPPPAHLPSKSNTAATSNGVRQKLPGKALGLVPRFNDSQQDMRGVEDGSDIDEEAMYAELGNKLTFEHNGVFTSLKSEADLIAWKKERQRNWPTTGRVAEKNAERWRIGQERKRLLAAAIVLRPPPQYQKRTHRGRGTRRLEDVVESEASTAKTSDDHSTSATEVSSSANPVLPQSREEQLAELRRKVAESEARNREAKERDIGSDSAVSQSQGTDGALEDRGVEEESRLAAASDQEAATDEELDIQNIDEDDQVDNLEDEVDNAEVMEDSLSSSSLDISSNSSSDSESDDSAPEEETSKPAPLPDTHRDRPLCKYYRDRGWCIHGDKCRYRHDANAERTIAPIQRPTFTQQEREERRKTKAAQQETQPARKSIFQRLLDQEDAEADKLALQVIKYLGGAGLFAETPVQADV